MEMNLTEYEKQQFEKIQEWKNEKPSIIKQLEDKLMMPVSWLLGKIIPPKAIEGAIEAFNSLAEVLTDPDDIRKKGNVNSIMELRTKEMNLSDNLAEDVKKWALCIAAGEGAAMGAAGFIGLIVDIPALITMSLRVIQKIGLCYGYECNSTEEQHFVLGILSASSSNTVKEKIIAMSTLTAVRVAIKKNTWKALEKAAAKGFLKKPLETAIFNVRKLAKKVGLNLTKRKALGVVPYIGAGVGAALNYAYLNDVSYAAIRVYQERWLHDNNKIDESCVL